MRAFKLLLLSQWKPKKHCPIYTPDIIVEKINYPSLLKQINEIVISTICIGTHCQQLRARSTPKSSQTQLLELGTIFSDSLSPQPRSNIMRVRLFEERDAASVIRLDFSLCRVTRSYIFVKSRAYISMAHELLYRPPKLCSTICIYNHANHCTYTAHSWMALCIMYKYNTYFYCRLVCQFNEHGC